MGVADGGAGEGVLEDVEVRVAVPVDDPVPVGVMEVVSVPVVDTEVMAVLVQDGVPEDVGVTLGVCVGVADTVLGSATLRTTRLLTSDCSGQSRAHRHKNTT